MANNSQTYTAAVALEGWNYIRYVGPAVNPQTEPLFLCVRQGDLVVAPHREPAKLGEQWYVNRLRAEDDDVNKHACSFKHEGTQTYVNYDLPASQRDGEAVLGPQVRFDLLRVDAMRKPCHIKVHQEPCAPEEPENSNCEAGTGDTEPTDDEQMETEAEPIETDAVPIDTGAVPTEADVPIETGAEPIAIDAEEYGEMIEGPQEPPPPLEWYLGISENLKVVIKPFPLSPEGRAETANEWPVWELTTRDEAIFEDNPPPPPPPRDPRAVNDPRRREYYTRPDRFDLFEKDFWPSKSRPK